MKKLALAAIGGALAGIVFNFLTFGGSIDRKKKL
jgi:hypothetical protein